MNKACNNCRHDPSNNGLGYWTHDPCWRCHEFSMWWPMIVNTNEQPTDSKDDGMAFEPKPGDRVMLGDYQEGMLPGRLLYVDTDTQYPFVGRRDGSMISNAYRFCEPIHPDLPMDHPVWVWMNDPKDAKPRCFAGEFTSDGNIVCWIEGRIKHTANNESTAWYHWSEIDPNAKP
jgi:hypothetical protein